MPRLSNARVEKRPFLAEAPEANLKPSPSNICVLVVCEGDLNVLEFADDFRAALVESVELGFGDVQTGCQPRRHMKADLTFEVNSRSKRRHCS